METTETLTALEKAAYHERRAQILYKSGEVQAAQFQETRAKEWFEIALAESKVS